MISVSKEVTYRIMSIAIDESLSFQIQVAEQMAGSEERMVSVSTSGGEVGNYLTDAEQSALFAAAERIVSDKLQLTAG